ncbi:unnamed protein product [Triticum turgidum subsp. durum]|uniref:RRM domain-containing protein n=1 Tax=Triticum turgidum subsp. durum TaxID=4567 RepID=A0A9R0RCI7_TRITD|nr:unnamed protein product [Triticum turgidum subsp. durum]
MAPPLLLLILENRILLFFNYVEHLLVILFCSFNTCNYFLKVGRIKQKRGYKDQWPWNIKIYTDDSGKAKGDACLAYEDPSAAHSAGGFYNDYDMRGRKISVVMAEKSAPRAPTSGHGPLKTI